MSQFVRRLVEAVCEGTAVTAESLVATVRQEKLTALSGAGGEEGHGKTPSRSGKKAEGDKPKRPRGRPRKEV
jgi:hypothetical protein